MDASKLTPDQGLKLADRVGPMLGYVYRLACRMQQMGWKPDDPLYVAAWESYYALHALHVHARYASCKPGSAGRPLQPTEPQQPRWVEARGVPPPVSPKSPGGPAH